jgi:WD40 repeat protein
VHDVAFSRDGRRLATVSRDRTTKIWNVATREEEFTLSGHADGVWAVAFHPQSERIATGSWDRTLRVYALDVDGLKELAKSRVTRSLTTAECVRWLHLKKCP